MGLVSSLSVQKVNNVSQLTIYWIKFSLRLVQSGLKDVLELLNLALVLGWSTSFLHLELLLLQSLELRFSLRWSFSELTWISLIFPVSLLHLALTSTPAPPCLALPCPTGCRCESYLIELSDRAALLRLCLRDIYSIDWERGELVSILDL